MRSLFIIEQCYPLPDRVPPVGPICPGKLYGLPSSFSCIMVSKWWLHWSSLERLICHFIFAQITDYIHDFCFLPEPDVAAFRSLHHISKCRLTVFSSHFLTHEHQCHYSEIRIWDVLLIFQIIAALKNSRLMFSDSVYFQTTLRPSRAPRAFSIRIVTSASVDEMLLQFVIITMKETTIAI